MNEKLNIMTKYVFLLNIPFEKLIKNLLYFLSGKFKYN